MSESPSRNPVIGSGLGSKRGMFSIHLAQIGTHMMQLPAFLVAKTALTIEINGIHIPFNEAHRSLKRFCRPLLFRTGDSTYEIAFSGSSFMFSYQGKNILLCTRHQFKRPQSEPFTPAEIIIPYRKDDQTIGVGPIGAQHPKPDEIRDKTFDDVIAVHFERDVADGELEKYFVHFDWANILHTSNIQLANVVCYFCIGYPHIFTDYGPQFNEDYEPTGFNMISRWCCVYLEPTQRQEDKFDLETRLQFKIDPRAPMSIKDFDGFSGSPVFFIYKSEKDDYKWGFAGMVTHVREEIFQVYSGNDLQSFVLSAFAST